VAPPEPDVDGLEVDVPHAPEPGAAVAPRRIRIAGRPGECVPRRMCRRLPQRPACRIPWRLFPRRESPDASILHDELLHLDPRLEDVEEEVRSGTVGVGRERDIRLLEAEFFDDDGRSSGRSPAPYHRL